MEENRLIIRPSTKVGELLDVYPELEEVLIGIVPAFQKLKNPLLRKTIARVTSLKQAATVGKVRLDQILLPLQEAVGQSPEILSEEEIEYFNNRPKWFDKNEIVETIDAARLLDEGRNPLGIILNLTAHLEEKKIIKVVHHFVPAPVIDELVDKGFDYWLTRENNLLAVYFSKQN